MTILKRVAAILLSFVAIFIVVVIVSEERRSQRLKSFAKVPVPEGLHKVGLIRGDRLFDKDFTSICVMTPYSKPQDIVDADADQAFAIDKLDLPSEDLSWYLLAFNGKAPTYIALVGAADAGQLISSSRCFNRLDKVYIKISADGADKTIREITFYNQD